ncbi:uncharacterized protein BKA78DRAFT_175951 [Phyllosticta capitalensis]|uniref:uncharacterized protein n=1 Tax=Phyllosticta capitalensis TaxID=121624 RepID=UPI00312D6BE3
MLGRRAESLPAADLQRFKARLSQLTAGWDYFLWFCLFFAGNDSETARRRAGSGDCWLGVGLQTVFLRRCGDAIGDRCGSKPGILSSGWLVIFPFMFFLDWANLVFSCVLGC